jgi:hypothetical protein
MKSNESDNLRSSLEGGKLTSGEPDAVKVASPVRRGVWRDVLRQTRSVLTLRLISPGSVGLQNY